MLEQSNSFSLSHNGSMSKVKRDKREKSKKRNVIKKKTLRSFYHEDDVVLSIGLSLALSDMKLVNYHLLCA